MNSVTPKVFQRASLFRLTIPGFASCVLLAAILSGCNGEKPKPLGLETSSKTTVVISLETTLHGLLPEEYEINVPRDLPTADLSEWGKSMLADMIDQDVDEKQLATSLSKYLPDETVQRVLRSQYVLRDSTHVRDMLWARELVRSAIEGSASEIDQVVDLFYFVVNTVQIVPVQSLLPFGPFETVFYGQGTEEDRAWAFACLLKQLRIPSVVLVNETPAGDDESPRVVTEQDTGQTKPGDAATDSQPRSVIVGVLLNDGLYLFDAGLGLPIPGPDDVAAAGLIRMPATLAQILADPSLLQKLSQSDTEPYSVTVDRLKNSRPLIIGDSTLWSRRMEGLQNGMAGEITASVFEPLVSQGDFIGSIELVSSHLTDLLPSATVGVWDYPEQQREARETVAGDRDQSALLAAFNDTFKVPQPITVTFPKVDPGAATPQQSPTPTIEIGASWGVHQTARIDQILGRPENAIPAYLKVQSWRELPPSPDDTAQVPPALQPLVIQHLPADMRARHLLAAEEALIWRATCQMQKKNYEGAATDLERYLRQLSTRVHPGRYRIEANYLAGISLAMAGNTRRATAFLRNVDADNSRYELARTLIRRWPPERDKTE